ncbi:hypothetical protein C8Q69DRAFT_440295 [Paecilomyces variotii]|uniref:Uncharacterized protein n=1 Tax=Byssochlamys spectabilis TaxID=264951 RepID=A0A443I575_BYSSP|nr:hypothetical protein C8Q69DRAFT_440295 [Paecilomyces variotii]RWQ99187.1 hypothetical protein C8Q69DRAFT_440295 [Paecilomyces variotii]
MAFALRQLEADLLACGQPDYIIRTTSLSTIGDDEILSPRLWYPSETSKAHTLGASNGPIGSTTNVFLALMQEQCLMSVLETHALEHEVMDNFVSLAMRWGLSRPAAVNMSSDTQSKSDTNNSDSGFLDLECATKRYAFRGIQQSWGISEMERRVRLEDNIIDELCKITAAREHFRLGNGVLIENHANSLDDKPEKDPQSSSRPSRPDSFFIHQRGNDVKSVVMTIEYKPPHNIIPTPKIGLLVS